MSIIGQSNSRPGESTARVRRTTGEHRRDRNAQEPARYLVRGAMPFPIDMLRYDGAWPASEEDSHKIEATVRHDNTGRVDVVVYARRYLTEGRWQSFGWHVIGCVDE